MVCYMYRHKEYNEESRRFAGYAVEDATGIGEW